MWTALLVVAAALARSGPPKYIRYELFELALCAERVVTGEIQSVDSSSFVLRVEERIAGTSIPVTLTVERFEDWSCASRWTAYRSGQQVLLFLDPSSPAKILGGGGEGEMPLTGSRVVVRDYDVRGYESGSYEVRDGEASGSLVDLDEVVAAVRGMRAALRWEGERRPYRVEPLDDALARAFETSSRLATHLVDEARSSDAWVGSFDADERRIPRDELRSISEELLTRAGGALAFLGDVDGDGTGEGRLAPW